MPRVAMPSPAGTNRAGLFVDSRVVGYRHPNPQMAFDTKPEAAAMEGEFDLAKILEWLANKLTSADLAKYKSLVTGIREPQAMDARRLALHNLATDARARAEQSFDDRYPHLARIKVL